MCLKQPRPIWPQKGSALCGLVIIRLKAQWQVLHEYNRAPKVSTAECHGNFNNYPCLPKELSIFHATQVEIAHHGWNVTQKQKKITFQTYVVYICECILNRCMMQLRFQIVCAYPKDWGKRKTLGKEEKPSDCLRFRRSCVEQGCAETTRWNEDY